MGQMDAPSQSLQIETVEETDPNDNDNALDIDAFNFDEQQFDDEPLLRNHINREHLDTVQSVPAGWSVLNPLHPNTEKRAVEKEKDAPPARNTNLSLRSSQRQRRRPSQDVILVPDSD